MFLQGQIVFAVCPNGAGTQKIAPHYLVVLSDSPEGVLCMFTTTLKERSGGIYAFTEAERQAAGFSKPCRFDPSRLVLYKPEHRHLLKRCAGRLHQRMLRRLVQAAISVKASYTTFRQAA